MTTLQQINPTQLDTDHLRDRGLAWSSGPPATNRSHPQRATYTAEEVAALLGVSTWSIYKAVKDDGAPVPPIRVGRRLVWSRAAVDAALSAPISTEVVS